MRLSRALPLALALACGPALAQTSQKPIQIIVPFAPGASADGAARIVANELGPRLNRQVVVENKAGAGGALGLQQLAKSAPDGDTLGVGATGALLLNPNLPSNPGPDLLRELAPVAKLIDVAIVLVANHLDRAENHSRDDRALQDDARRPRLRLDRHQYQPAPLGRAAQAGDRREPGACPLPRQRPGGGRSAGRANPAGVGRPHLRLSAHPGRPPDRARTCRQQALSGNPGNSHHRRRRRAGLRTRLRLHRPVCARGNAGPGGQEALARGRSHSRHAGRADHRARADVGDGLRGRRVLRALPHRRNPRNGSRRCRR